MLKKSGADNIYYNTNNQIMICEKLKFEYLKNNIHLLI